MKKISLVRIFRALEKQRENGSSPDIIYLVFDDGSKIPVHRSLLMAASDIFHKMFTNGMKESNQKEILINPPHIGGFKAMIDQVCYGKDDKLSYEMKIWVIICKEQYLVEYDQDELDINVPADGLGLLLYLAEILEYNDAIKKVLTYNCIGYNTDIPPIISDAETVELVLYDKKDSECFYIYKIINDGIYPCRNMHIFHDDFKNIQKIGTKIAYQCYDGYKHWIMILDKFGDIGDYVCFDPEAIEEKISFHLGKFIYALHPVKNHIMMVGSEYIFVFDYRERKQVKKYKIDFNSPNSNNNNDHDNNLKITDIVLSCNGKYTLYVTNSGNRYIFKGSKMIKKLSHKVCEAKFHPTDDNIVVFLNFDNGDYLIIVHNITTDVSYMRTSAMSKYNYYFSIGGKYLYIENKTNCQLTFFPLKPGQVEFKHKKIGDLDMDTITSLIPDPKNEQAIYYYIDGEIYWFNINKGIYKHLEDVRKLVPVRISGMLVLGETNN